MSHEWRRDASPATAVLLLDPPDHAPAGRASPRRRGRPAIMSREEVLEMIRRLASRPEGLFRVHDTHGHVYARARRQFGSWAAAVRAAGENYAQVVAAARRRSAASRRQATETRE
ncbi:MAG: hypothetical protein HOP12_11555 [Candidatus Eisenbacteria bacterium]|uniref:Uncharacterized protein n=1 Tax=Eiseniibacteriota bacterium TaxID=2212470 RepID=A0A849SK17_UNCEI|nr:hypothetical protein [Candidatus Eisenbacteria bacterium]